MKAKSQTSRDVQSAAKQTVKDISWATWTVYSAEEQIRIVLCQIPEHCTLETVRQKLRQQDLGVVFQEVGYR